MEQRPTEQLVIKIPRVFSDATSRPEKPETIEDFLSTGQVEFRPPLGAEVDPKAYLPGSLVDGQHALYFGKSLEVTKKRRILEVVGLTTVQRGTYNQEIIRTALDFGKQVRAVDAKVRIVLANSMSELFNGEESMQGHLGFEQESAMVLAQARAAGLSAQEIEILSIEEIPKNKPLFDVLRSEQRRANAAKENPNYGQAIKGTALKTSDYRDPLTLAALFLEAASKNKQLKKDLNTTSPHSLAENKADNKPNKDDRGIYAIVELSIRISDLLSGVCMQGGVDRQAKYDRFIWEFIKGEKGKYKSVEELKGLLEQLADAQFSTIHIKQNNYHRQKLNQGIARTRIAVFASLALSLLAGTSQISRQKGLEEARAEQQARIADEAKAVLAEAFSDRSFRFEAFAEEKERNPGIVEGFSNEVIVELELRYGVKDGKLKSILKPLVLQYLITMKNHLPWQSMPYGWEKYNLIFLTDKFVSENKIFFLSQGYNFKEPYSHLKHYMEDEDLFEYEKEIFVDNSEMQYIKSLGKFETPWEEYEIYLLPNGQGGYTLVTEDEGKSVRDKEYQVTSHCLTTARNAKLRKDFTSDQEYFLALPHRYEYNDLIFNTTDTNMLGYNDREFEIDNDNYSLTKMPGFKDYEIRIYNHFDKATALTTKYLVARKKGEEKFTTSRGREVANMIRYDLFPFQKEIEERSR